MLLALLLACHTAPEPPLREEPPTTAPWTRGLPPLAPIAEGVAVRSIVHLHSPWSHDACDGEGLIDGEPNQSCLEDLRAGLCEAGIDVAFLTDHPSHSAEVSYDELFMEQPGDQAQPTSNIITCDDGRTVLWLPGVEDELMPLGLDRQVSDDPVEADRLFNGYDAEAVMAERDAGAVVLVAHTEHRPAEELMPLQDAGLQGMEIFNLHAMFDPRRREDDLGLDGLAWVTDIQPFTAPESTGEVDLYFLGVLQRQQVSVDRWDTLNQRGPMIGVARTDAHQNVLPLAMRDGERGDSYRRMLRWFSNIILADERSAEAAERALAAGRSFVAFEALGTPQGFDFTATLGEDHFPMGSTTPSGVQLNISCPTVQPDSPHGELEAEIEVRLLKDGQPFATGCGSFESEGPGVYRVEVDITPHHLVPFLGEEPEIWLRPFPWLYSNPIRVGL